MGRSLDPHKIRGREDVWWYEERYGISVVVQLEEYDDTTIIPIPWRALREALKRHDETKEDAA